MKSLGTNISFFIVVCLLSALVFSDSNSVSAAISVSADARRNILLLFGGVSPLPESWSLSTPIEKWVGIATRATPQLPSAFFRKQKRDHPFGCDAERSDDEQHESSSSSSSSSAMVTHIAPRRPQNLKGALNLDALYELDKLFPNLRELNLHGHRLGGEFYFNRLPSGLKTLHLLSSSSENGSNKMSGILDISTLPPALTFLNLANNRFTNRENSNLNWRALARLASLETFFLQGNLFFGEIGDGFRHLPASSLRQFSIDSNNFSGVANLSSFPPMPHRVLILLHGNPRLRFVAKKSRFPPLMIDSYSVEQLSKIQVVRVEKEADEIDADDSESGGELAMATTLLSGDALHRASLAHYSNTVRAAIDLWQALHQREDHGLGATHEEVVATLLRSNRAERISFDPSGTVVSREMAALIRAALDVDSERRPTVAELKKLLASAV